MYASDIMRSQAGFQVIFCDSKRIPSLCMSDILPLQACFSHSKPFQAYAKCVWEAMLACIWAITSVCPAVCPAVSQAYGSDVRCIWEMPKRMSQAYRKWMLGVCDILLLQASGSVWAMAKRISSVYGKRIANGC